MATYDPTSLGISAPSGGFQQGGWYGGRQYWGGTLSDPGVIHESSNQQGAGQTVSAEVNLQSDTAQGNQQGDIANYLAQQRQQQPTQAAPQQQRVAPGGYGDPGGEIDGSGISGSQPTINLPELYQGLFDQSGINEIDADLATKEREFTEAKAKINDNPFLSEATRVGRVAKMETQFAERTANLRNEAATKRADIETQMNIQTAQFDIESQQAQQAIEQFNSLLSMGALDNATGEAIANITRATGIDSSLIQSAIDASKKQEVDTSAITSTDDNGVTTVSIINSKTGELINQTSLGGVSKVTKSSGGGSTSPAKNTQQTFLSDASTSQPINTDQGHVGIFPQLVAQYAPFMTLKAIYDLYLQSEPGQKFGSPSENAKEIQELYDYYRGK
jgi:hypothetical protein